VYDCSTTDTYNCGVSLAKLRNEVDPSLMKNNLYIFDMGGVMTGSFWVWENICKTMGIPDAENAAKRHGGLIDAACRGDISSEECLALIARREHCAEPKENLWRSFFKPTVNTDTVRLVEELRAAGNRVVCGTNVIDVHYDYHTEHGEYTCFDKVYASHLIRQIKPDITFWHCIKAAEKSYAFEDMFFFDDTEENVAAAQSLGIHAHRFTTADDARAFIKSVQ